MLQGLLEHQEVQDQQEVPDLLVNQVQQDLPDLPDKREVQVVLDHPVKLGERVLLVVQV